MCVSMHACMLNIVQIQKNTSMKNMFQNRIGNIQNMKSISLFMIKKSYEHPC